MALVRSFIHGNAIVAENVGGSSIGSSGPLNTTQHPFSKDNVPLSDVVGLPQGWGKTYRGKAGQSVWFHAAVPTPNIVLDSNVSNNLALKRIFVIFNGQGNCFISDVHIWNGSIPIGFRYNLHITGHHQSMLSEPDLNAFTLWESDRSDPFITMGLGISVYVKFPSEADITFFSAGAEFSVNKI